MFKGLLEAIEKADIITLFRHVNADMDAYGSQFGLKYWIHENYPEKQVYVLGQDQDLCLFEANDVISNETIQNSLAIVMDCSDINRVDDQRFLSAYQIISIDHHPSVHHFMHDDFRFIEFASTCEILAEFFLQTKKNLSVQVASCLYRGILTDTASFKTNNTSAHTLKIAAELCAIGVDIVKCNMEAFEVSRNDFDYATYLRTHAIFESCGLVYCILKQEDYKHFNISATQARNQVYQFHGVKEFKIWCIFTEEMNGSYNGSIRSKTLPINQIATLFHGGGHACASGVKDLSKNEIEICLEKLRNLLKND